MVAGAESNIKTPTKQKHEAVKQASKPLTEQEKKQYQEMVAQASKLMGHIGIANIALFHDMLPEATANVKAALETARKLEAETDQFNTEMMKLGKIKYKTAKGSHDFWLPVLNDAFAVRTVDAEYMKSKKPSVEIVDAKLVHTSVELDTKAIRGNLENADAALQAKNYGEVQAALSAAADSTFTEQDISDLPLETVRDNLILARALAKDKNYGSAKFALGHAQDTLKEYQAAAPKDNSEVAQKLQKEIAATQADIVKGSPNVLKEIESKITKWVVELEHLNGKNST